MLNNKNNWNDAALEAQTSNSCSLCEGSPALLLLLLFLLLQLLKHRPAPPSKPLPPDPPTPSKQVQSSQRPSVRSVSSCLQVRTFCLHLQVSSVCLIHLLPVHAPHARQICNFLFINFFFLLQRIKVSEKSFFNKHFNPSLSALSSSSSLLPH